MKCHTNVTNHNFLIEVKFNGNSEEKEQNKLYRMKEERHIVKTY